MTDKAYINGLLEEINICDQIISKYEELNPNTIDKIEDRRKTVVSDLGTDNVHKVNSNKYNVVRKISWKVKYNIIRLVDEENRALNFIK